jgi:RHS repeat-associated protein
MKKTILFIALAILVFPILTKTALIQTELTYKPRNAKGIYSFGTYLGTNGQVNLVNGNLVYKEQLVSRPGRAGFNLDLSIYYNSNIWDRNANGMYVPNTGSWVGIGWYLGFAKLIQGSSSYAIVFPDGSSHEIQQNSNGVWQSIDSTYILLNVSTNTATLKGGTNLVFGNTVGNASYLTKMEDTNGNQITASYLSGTGKLSQVNDTLGLAATFTYNQTTGCLQSITSYGKFNGTISFGLTSVGSSPLTPSFSVPTQVPTGEYQLNSITFNLSDRTLSQNYTYNYLGEISTIFNSAQYNGNSSNTFASFTFGTFSFSDPVYTNVQERAVTSRADSPDGINYYNTSFNYTFNGNESAPSQTTVTDIRGITQYYFNTSLYPAFSWSDGLIASMQRTNLSGTTIYRTNATNWQQDSNVSFIDNPRPISLTTTLDNGLSMSTDYVYTTDGTGNISQIIQYMFGNANILRTTTFTYLYQSNSSYAAANMITIPASISIADGNGTTVSQTNYGYDEYPLTLYQGPVTNHDTAYENQNITVRGNRTSIRNDFIQQSRFLTTTSKYDMVGNVVSVTDPKNNPPTTTVFSSATNYVLPQSVTNALGQQSQETWVQYYSNIYFYNGNLASATDPNGAQVQYWYDQLGRTTQTTTPYETQNFLYSDSQYQSTETSSSGTQLWTNYASGGLYEASQSNPTGGYITSQINYNNPWWQPSYVSYPGSNANTSYTYDPMGRILTKITPDGGTTAYQYVGNTVTVTYPENNQKEYTYNELGHVSQVNEPNANGNLTIVTTYSYNVLGKLIQVVQIGQGSNPNQTRTFTYDSLSRMTSETHPESVTTTYTYDDDGNILTKTDARGIVATSTYDALNRRTGTTYSDGTPSVSYSYDQATSNLIGVISNGIGRMTSAWTSDGVGYSWTFDAGGRATQQVASIYGVQYSHSFSYTASGCGCSQMDLQSLSYPSGLVINYNRDSINRITSIKRSTGATYASYQYNSPSGAVSQFETGDYVTQTYSYDSMNRLTSNAIISMVSWNLSYNFSSQISQITENIGSSQATYTYSYDQVGRLISDTHATYSGGSYVTDQTDTVSYDQFGNILSNITMAFNPYWEPVAGAQTLNPNPANNMLNSYTAYNGYNGTVTYDAAGNMITDSGRGSYTYNAVGRMIGSNYGNVNTGTYQYDAFGRRIKKTYLYGGNDSGTIISIYGPRNELLTDYTTDSLNGNSYTDYILNGSQAIARRTVPLPYGSTTITYLHRNHLNQVFNPNTYTKLTSLYGQPFGLAGNDQFPGQKDDPESGLHYNIARSFNPAFSRWPSPDSKTAHVYDPQSLNKYTYVRNDPINHVDPDGRDTNCVDPSATFCVSVTAPAYNYYDDSYYDPFIDPTIPPSPAYYWQGFNQSFVDWALQPAEQQAQDQAAAQSINCHSLAVGQAPSLSLSQWVTSYFDAEIMTALWAAGIGPTSYVFGPLSPESFAMMAAYGLPQIISNFLAGTGQSSGIQEFGLIGLWSSGFNPTRQFVGSYEWSLSLQNGILNITITNTTTAWSAFGHAPFLNPNPPTRSGFQPMGRVNQTFNISVPCP